MYLSREPRKFLFPVKNGKTGGIPNGKRISGHTSQAFRRETLKNRYEKKFDLWERSIAPPKLPHGCTAAFRTDGQVNVPDRLEQFCHGQPGITLPESLAALDPEDYFQVPGFHPVIEKSIIADLLETGREHMHQEASDKLSMAESDLPFWIPGFPATCRERNLCFRNGKDPVVGDSNPVGIASQIFDGVTKPVEGFFDVRAPVFPVKIVFKSFPFRGIM